jgi:hypothetical protein
LREFTVIVADPIPPWVKVIMELDEVTEKFAVDAVTTKVAEAESPTGLPVERIGYEPAVTLVTVNLPVNVPPEIEQVEPLTGLPDKEQVVSVDENPEPETTTVAPTAPETGVRVTVGPLNPNVAEAESPVGVPVAVIV